MHASPELDLARIKDQSHGPESFAFAEKLRNRVLSQHVPLSELSDALLAHDARTIHYLSGWDVPTAEELHALMPLLNIEDIAPDVRAVFDRNGRQTQPASYSTPQLRVRASLGNELERLRAHAALEVSELTERPAFDPVFLKLVSSERRSPEGGVARIQGNIPGHTMLKAAIMAPLQPSDTVASFTDLLCEYYDANLSQLNEAVGFNSGVLGHWRSGGSLPERNNFLQFRGWVEEKFDRATALKLSTMFIKEALERYKTDSQLRNLPPEYWAWQVQITNSPGCRFDPEQPAWASYVEPAQTQQEYFTALRRAHKLFRVEFQNITGVSPGQMQQFEAGYADETVQRTVVEACKELDATRLSHGDAPLFDGAVFAALPPIVPTATRTRALRQAAKPPSFTPEQHDRFAAQTKRIGAEGCAMVDMPETLAAFAKLDVREVAGMINNARRYMRISERQADASVRGTVANELLGLHKELNKRQIGMD